MNSKTKGQLAREGKREAPTIPAKDIPYPLIPSWKDKDKYFARFLDFFRKLELPEGLKKADLKYCKEKLATMVVKDPALAL